MKKPSNISHPLINRTGTSQRTRIIEALDSDSVPIDGKTLADQLYIISKYAQQINYYELIKDDIQGEYQEIGNWTSFFQGSLPFQLAVLGKTSINAIETEYKTLYQELKNNPSKQGLESLLIFIDNKFIIPVDRLYDNTEKEENSFATSLLAIIKSSFVEPLKTFITVYNASATFLCVTKKSFSDFLVSPWILKVEDVYAYDVCIQRSEKGKEEAYLIAAETINSIFYQLLSGFQDIISAAPNFIEEALRPLQESLQERHQPHLGLLFTFLELFKNLQGDINNLGEKHLDFFYQQVLKIAPKEAEPDKAHVIFEIANHLDEYLLKEDLLLKNGKDVNNEDIQFGLDQEIIIDKAQISDLRTLSLNKIIDDTYIEGVYMAPVANSADGLGEKFKKDQSVNWPTLGSKFSKNTESNNLTIKEHPKARLGFVLSSPVLLLQEGERNIKILLGCDVLNNDGALTPAEINEILNDIKTKLVVENEKTVFNINDQILEECNLSLTAKKYISSLLVKSNPYKIEENDLETFFKVEDPISCQLIFDQNDEAELRRCLRTFDSTRETKNVSLFNVWFSGEKDWIPATPTLQIYLPPEDELTLPGQIEFELNVDLDAGDPAIVFYNEENLKEKFDLKTPFPLVRIEINEDVEIECNDLGKGDDACCLKRSQSNGEKFLSPYHFLKQLKLVDAKIDVKVCGVKNLIVQNDDNLQDVNKPIQPFGPRPKVGGLYLDENEEEKWFVDGGANFYIGSKEIFCKNWQKFWINTTWKDKPLDLKEHYELYKDPEFEDGSTEIENGSFRFLTSILEDGTWKKDLTPKLVDEETRPELLRLFESYDLANDPNPCLTPKDQATFCHRMERTFTPENLYNPKSMPIEPLEPLTVNTRKGFIRLTLAGVSFQHNRFTFVLTRQLLALAGLVDPKSISDALQELEEAKTLATETIAIIDSIILDMEGVIGLLENLKTQMDGIPLVNTVLPDLLPLIDLSLTIQSSLSQANDFLIADPPNPAAAQPLLADGWNNVINLNALLGLFDQALNDFEDDLEEFNIETLANFRDEVKDNIDIIIGRLDIIIGRMNSSDTENPGIRLKVEMICTKIESVLDKFDTTLDLGLPKEPYTPLIRALYIDYEAIASKDDIEIVHLYPFENTSKLEDIEQNPTLLPFFDDEGTLFIGIENLNPGGNLSILFQLAEATANSEIDRADLDWYYLTNNNWVALLPEFNIISDGTNGLTVSGIVTIALPGDINKIGNTVMPDNLHWIKVSTPQNAKAVAETIGIHTQAAKASARFSEGNDTSRLNKALEAGSISKLSEGDFSVKKVEQLYPSFDGRQPEDEGHFYIRVSEHLKHKGRALMLNDYEKVVLEGFPEIYKTKCISHTMGLSAIEYHRDLEIAPGYIVITVIPDLTKLVSGNQLEPKVPVSLLEKIENHLRKKISPFARIRVMNPRYEYVNVDINVRLYRGKSQNFYKQKLKEDITNLLAPWFLGDSEKIAFGMPVLFSDVIGFVEQLDYVDFITSLELSTEGGQSGSEIKPLTARSILTAGQICVVIDEEDCPDTGQVNIPSLEYESISSNKSSELS
ncbi:hypothetical protein [Aquimarina sp. MMG016]|uniref:hypothetical protein n=1 Tax=Aquimarina sp. MMG016 TaxID=2822690 RepID=UPI001B3A73EA|nr:hypothetical protein [Aquimarina sp. MMG016]MBQ4818578.1 hypothetical protein [Aquimarina sp. MMG016]